MAHQAHNIPWHLLADDLEYQEGDNTRSKPTDLYPCFRPDQGKRWNHFGRAFIKTLNEHTEVERRKYPATFNRPKPDEIVISDDTAKKIGQTVLKYRKDCATDFRRPEECSRHHSFRPDPGEPCTCGFTEEHRKASWLCQIDGQCYQNENDALEIANTLILHGEMESLLRLTKTLPCSNLYGQHFPFSRAKEACYCMDQNRGWGPMLRQTLAVYICFNVLFCKPELWPSQQEDGLGESIKKDYRRTAGYQSAVIMSVDGSGKSHQAPHLYFHGYDWEDFSMSVAYEESGSVGYETLDEIRTIQKESIRKGSKTKQESICERPAALPPCYSPTRSDVDRVHSILYSKGLPAELCFTVLKYADYDQPKRRSIIQDDPLHPANSEVLVKYLNHCWRVLIQLNMLAREATSTETWEEDIADSIYSLWCSRRPISFRQIRQYPAWEAIQHWREEAGLSYRLTAKQKKARAEAKEMMEKARKSDQLRRRRKVEKKSVRREKKKERAKEKEREKEEDMKKDSRRLEKRKQQMKLEKAEQKRLRRAMRRTELK